MPDEFLAGAQIGLQAAQGRIRSAQEDREFLFRKMQWDATAPQRAAGASMLGAQIKSANAKAVTDALGADLAVKGQESMAEALDFSAQLRYDGSTEDLIALDKFTSRRPWLHNTPWYSDTKKNINTSILLNSKSDLAIMGMESREGIAGDKLEAEKTRRLTTDALAAQRIRNEQDRLNLQKLGFGLREIDQLMKARELGVEVKGGPAIPSTPNGVQLIPVERPLTTPTTTQLQKESLTARNALTALGEGLQAIQTTPQAIGVRGIAGSAIEKVQGQLNPNAQVATPITEARQKASIAFSNVAKSLRVDSGNMSRYELTKLEQAGDVLDWTESAQTAAAKLKNLQAVVIGKELRNLKDRHAKPDNELLKQIPASEIFGLRDSGLFSEEDFVRWHTLHNP